MYTVETKWKFTGTWYKPWTWFRWMRCRTETITINRAYLDTLSGKVTFCKGGVTYENDKDLIGPSLDKPSLDKTDFGFNDKEVKI